MKQILSIKSAAVISLFILLFSVQQGFTHHTKAETNNSSLVIVKIKGLNADVFNKLTTEINKHNEISLEYSCLQSDVVVVKYNHGFTEKADVQHYINSNFKKWGGVKSIEFIYIDLHSTGVSKC